MGFIPAGIYTDNMKEFSDCGFPLAYLFINTYTGNSKWLPYSEGKKLIEQDNYWELDNTTKPVVIY